MRLSKEERLLLVDHLQEIKGLRGANKDIVRLVDESLKIVNKKRGRKVGWRKKPWTDDEIPSNNKMDN